MMPFYLFVMFGSCIWQDLWTHSICNKISSDPNYPAHCLFLFNYIIFRCAAGYVLQIMSLPVTLLSLTDVKALTWDAKSNTKKQNNIWFITARLKKDICDCSISPEPRGFQGDVGLCWILGRTTKSLMSSFPVWLILSQLS